MSIRAKLARTVAAVGLVTAGIAGGLATASPASADPILPIDWNIDATTTLAGLGITQTVTGGSFTASADLGNGTVSGNLNLPPADISVKILGINLADVGFAITPVGPTTGTFDLSTLTVSMTSSFNIKIPHLNPLGLDFLNLVGSRCQTATPITLTMSGPVDLVNGSTFTGEFTIPKFKDCGLLTFALNLIIPGDGNTFTATATPKA
jgi:hypothetical protein